MTERNKSSTSQSDDDQIERYALELSTRQVENDWNHLIGIYFLNIVLLLLIIFVFYQFDLFKPISDLTFGLFNETLIATLILIVIVIWGGIIRKGNQEWANIGVNNTEVKVACLITGILWIAMNLIELFIGFVVNGKIIFNSIWAENGITVVIGYLIAQLFGVAIQEELLFRGYLFPQLTTKANSKWQDNPTLAVFVAIMAANIVFSLMHVPIQLYYANDFLTILWNLFILLGLGVFFTLIYLLTENLWIAIGVHALGNTPTLIVSPIISPNVILYVMVLILCLIWPRIQKE
jgi:hypothetical protein